MQRRHNRTLLVNSVIHYNLSCEAKALKDDKQGNNIFAFVVLFLICHFKLLLNVLRKKELDNCSEIFSILILFLYFGLFRV